MKLLQHITIAAAMLAASLTAAGADIDIDGITYTTKENATATCRATKPKDPAFTEAIVKPSVMIDGQPYTVTRVDREGFRRCRHLRSVTLPNTIKRIGMNAFADCSELQSIVMPDASQVDITAETYGYGGNGPFTGCKKLTDVRGNTLEYPAYVLYTAFRKCDDVPFAAQIPSLKVSEAPSTILYAAAEAAAAQSSPQPDPVSPVDANIPRTATDNTHTFAVVIGNEEYQRGTAAVPYAAKDARVFAEYCHRALGIPEANIRTYYNATYGDMITAVKDITSIADAYHGDISIIFYYAGHGVPDEKNREAYLVPVDADGTMTEVCYPMANLYERLGSLGARSVTVFLDACFSGATRNDDMLMAARAVRMRAASTRPVGRMVVFSATSGEQTAFPYREMGHGIFTYYLLEKMQQSKGAMTLGELADHVAANVAQQSVVINRKVQIPTVSASPEIFDQWQQMKLR